MGHMTDTTTHLDEWIRKPQAAAILDRSHSQFHKRAKAAGLEVRYVKNGNITESLYSRKEVEALKHEMQLQSVRSAQPMHLPPPVARPDVALQVLAPLLEQLRAFQPAAAPPEPLFIGLRDATARLGLTAPMVRAAAEAGQVRAALVGGQLRIHREDLGKVSLYYVAEAAAPRKRARAAR
jgi:hypothetical protein